MKNITLFILGSIFLTLQSVNSYAQNNFITLDKSKEDSLKVQAKRMANATTLLDTLTFIKHSYPGIIDRFFNGANNVGSSFKTGWADAIAMGFKQGVIEIGGSKGFAKSKDEIYTFIETKSVTIIREDTLKAESFLLAISNDGGDFWYFIDASFIWVTDIKTLFPNYNGVIPLPVKKEPIYIEKVKNGS